MFSEVKFRYQSNYDGDTVDGQMAVPFEGTLHGLKQPISGEVWLPVSIRVLGVDCEEIKSHSEKAKAAKAFTADWCQAAANAPGLVLVTEWKREKYGRLLAYIQEDETGDDLTERLIEAGLGVAYDGGKRG